MVGGLSVCVCSHRAFAKLHFFISACLSSVTLWVALVSAFSIDHKCRATQCSLSRPSPMVHLCPLTWGGLGGPHFLLRYLDHFGSGLQVCESTTTHSQFLSFTQNYNSCGRLISGKEFDTPNRENVFPKSLSISQFKWQSQNDDSSCR